MDKDLRQSSRDPYSVEALTLRLRSGDLTQWQLILAALAGCEAAAHMVGIPPGLGPNTNVRDKRNPFVVRNNTLALLSNDSGFGYHHDPRDIVNSALGQTVDGKVCCDGCGTSFEKSPAYGQTWSGDGKASYLYILCVDCYRGMREQSECRNPYHSGASASDIKRYFKTSWSLRQDLEDPYRTHECSRPAVLRVGADRIPMCEECSKFPAWQNTRIREPIHWDSVFESNSEPDEEI